MFVRAFAAAHALRRLAPLQQFRDECRAAATAIERSDAPDAAYACGALATVIALCDARDAELAPLRCPRCARHSPWHHVIVRPMLPEQERLCDGCVKTRLASGWHLLKTDRFSFSCCRCHNQHRVAHLVGPIPAEMEMRVCDACAAALAADGWLRAITITHAW